MTTPHPFAALVRRLDAEASKAPWRTAMVEATDALSYRHDIDTVVETDDGDALIAGMLNTVEMDEPNARAIVTLRNAAPEVAALVEAAGYVVKDALRDTDTEYQMWVGEHLIDALRAALDALAAKAKEVES